MKIEGWELIGVEEFNGLPNEERAIFQLESPIRTYHFKKAQKFPIVFDLGYDRELRVRDDGNLEFCDDDGIILTIFKHDIPILVKAVEKAKQVVGAINFRNIIAEKKAKEVKENENK